MLQATKNVSNLITSGDKAIFDFKGSTAVGGKRGVGGRRATNTWPRPVMYVPENERDTATQVYLAALRALPKSSGAGVSKYTRASAVAAGLPTPTIHDVQDSLNFDVYEAICEALGVPVGTFVDTNVFNKAKNGMRNTGMSRAEIEAEMDRLNIRGDARTSYYGSRELAYNNPKSRFHNVPYKDVLKGSVLTALGIIPLNTRNISEVLREIEGQSNIQASGAIPKQTTSYITDLATRRSELAASGDKVAQAVTQSGGDSSVAEQPAPDGSQGTEEDSSKGKDKKKSNATLLYGGIAVGILAVGGLAYWYTRD